MEAVVTRETHFDYQDFLNKLVHIFSIYLMFQGFVLDATRTILIDTVFLKGWQILTFFSPTVGY